MKQVFSKTVISIGTLLLAALGAACFQTFSTDTPLVTQNPIPSPEPSITRKKNAVKTIHVIVALCDNESQGIVPVSASLGNGDDPDKNLYWGARYGVRTYFNRSKDWARIKSTKASDPKILERIVYKHSRTSAILVADAHRGSAIKNSTIDFVNYSNGLRIEEITVDGKTLQIGGGADLIAYVGHNGLMDFDIPSQEKVEDSGKRDAIILACFSKRYFSKQLDKETTTPLVWTTNFMAPEAYVLHAALDKRLSGKGVKEVELSAARAYSKYQRISEKAGRGLFTSGW